MARNKIIYGGEVLIDLTADTAEQAKVLKGYTFHDKGGVVRTGTCTYDANTQNATAGVAEVLNNKTYYAQGEQKTGTMPNNGAYSQTISTKAQKVTIPIGFHDGSGAVQISSTEQAKIIQGNIKDGVTILGVTGTYSGDSTEVPQANKTVTPGKTKQTILPDDGYTCLMQVTVNAIPYTETANTYGTTVTIG